MNLQEILNDLPPIHQEYSGKLLTHKLSDEVLYFIDQQVSENSKTLETGSGISTILFAIKSTYHTCIVPDQQEVIRIKEYCQKNKISTEKIDFKIDYSQNVLPFLEINDLDLILIDGSHAFPIPFVDWQYTQQYLKVGGQLIIDDTQIHTAQILKQFLSLEQEWKFHPKSTPRTAIFTKVKQYTKNKEYEEQVYTIKNSRILVWVAKIKTAYRLLVTSNFSEFVKKFRALLG